MVGYLTPYKNPSGLLHITVAWEEDNNYKIAGIDFRKYLIYLPRY